MSSHSCWYESIGITLYKSIEIINSVGEAHPPAPRETRHAGQAHAVRLPSRPRVKSTHNVDNPGREGGHTQNTTSSKASSTNTHPSSDRVGGRVFEKWVVGRLRFGAAPRPVRWTVSRRLSSGMRSLRTAHSPMILSYVYTRNTVYARGSIRVCAVRIADTVRQNKRGGS